MTDKIEKTELMNMCMIGDGKGNVLVQDRVKSWRGIAFPGGHVEKYESVVDSVIREIKEETGLMISDVKLCGIKQWFSGDIRSICFLFRTDNFSGELKSNDEGRNFWIKRSDMENYRLAPLFDRLLEAFENPDINEYYHRADGEENIVVLK